MGLARCDLALNGNKLEFNTLEESLAIIAWKRQAEIEYLKIMAVVNAIIYVGNGIRSALSGDETHGGDSLKKGLESLEKMLLPHFSEENKDMAEKARRILMKEATRGPLKIRVMEDDKKKSGRVRIKKKNA